MVQEKIIFGTRVRLKSESKWMKFLGWVSKPFNPDFMTSYWTTVLTVVYAPSSFDINNESLFPYYQEVLEHEGIHIADFKKYKLLFILSYLLPYFRFVWERRAYLPELHHLLDKHQYTSFYKRLNRICDDLGGPNYFWAWYRPWIKKWFLKETGMQDDK